jgi:DNA primase
MSSSVEKIKERLSIVDVVSSYVKVEKAGANFRAKCPFHNEKTPSFFISPDRGTYYCFGCGAKGDIFTFVEEFEGLEFRQALTNLAAKAGVELVPEKAGERDEKERLFQVVEMAVEFFERELPGMKPVLEYLEKRGLTSETITKWRIGFVQNEWRSLYDYLKAKKVSDADMLAVGLIKRSDNAQSGQQYYDVFRGRIMFPIFDSSGRPVAFSGRIFVDDEKSPKYLNSPATVLFNKSEVLFGFDRAKSAIRKLNYSILVEGQMDLIMSHQAGLANTVASSGTALTEAHLRRLMRISPRIMFAFDSDSAGFNATKRSAELALQIGMEVKVASLPAGDDPASLIVKDPNLWKQALKNGKHIIDFYTDSLISRKLERRTLSREIKAEVLPFVLSVESKTEQAHFVKSIAEKSGLKEDALWDDVKTLIKAGKPSGGTLVNSNQNQAKTRYTAGPMPASRRKAIESRAIGVIQWLEGKKDHEKIVAAIRKKLVQLLGQEQAEAVEIEYAVEKEKQIFEAEQYYEQSVNLVEDVRELMVNLEEEVLKDELTKHMSELHQAEKNKDTKQAEECLKQCQEITNKLTALRKKKQEKEKI